ncbi:MAG: ComEA family DNA-binding protein [Acinetobacter sp.]|nr:ComEA family DNA-binding protein [Acinetobacter sp.]
MNIVKHLLAATALLVGSSAMANNFDQKYADYKKAQTNTAAAVAKTAPAPQAAKKGDSKAKAAAPLAAKVNINTATVKELQQLNGIGEAKAKAIVAHRKKAGNFKSVEDLKAIKGLGDAFINKNKANITF